MFCAAVNNSMLLGHAQRLLYPRQQAHCSNYIHLKQHNRGSTRLSKQGIAAVAPATTTAVTGRPAAVAKSTAVPASTDRVLFVGGLPGTEDPENIVEQLAALCAQWQPTRIEVAKFKRVAEKSKFAAGWKHKGHALLAFTSADALAAAADAVRSFTTWGADLTIGPAQKVPPHWPLELTMTPEELAALQQQQAAAEQRRAHNRRQRARQQQRLIDSVDMLLTGLPAPAGRSVLQQYKPLLGQQLQQYLAVQWQYNVPPDQQAVSIGINSGSAANWQLQHAQAVQKQYSVLPETLPSQPDCSTCSMTVKTSQQYSMVDHLIAVMPYPLRAVTRRDRLLHMLYQHQQQQQQGLIRLDAAPSVAAVEQQLLFDWSKMPAVVDPAFGGRLADADVVKAGAGRMNMRALRKRVQVESFALLLLQLTLPALASNTPLHIVEFGCGSGNLVLPLAHLFPCFSFTAVDMKASAIQLLRQRVHEGRIANVVNIQEGTIEMHSGPADVVLALHACGAASDWSLAQAAARSAAFIVSPCCIGKINKNNAAGLVYRTSSSSSSVSSSSSSSNNVDSSGSEVAVDAWRLAEQPAQQAAAQTVKQAVQQQPWQAVQQEDAQQAVQQQSWQAVPQENTQQAVQQEAWQAVQQAQLLQYPRSLWLTQHLRDLAAQIQAEQQQQPPVAPASQQQLHEQHQQQEQPQAATTSRVLNKLQLAVLQSDSRTAQCRAVFSLLAQAADYSHQEDHGYPDLAALAKSNVEFDRGRHMAEEGYEAALVRLLQPQLTAKSDVLIGVPRTGATGLDRGTAAAAAAAAGDAPATARQTCQGGCAEHQANGNSNIRFSWLWQ